MPTVRQYDGENARTREYDDENAQYDDDSAKIRWRECDNTVTTVRQYDGDNARTHGENARRR
ncbi:hypothetical protein DPMN_042525 [Dreissena polymorpha]|uniref:Uncharacterized protein n=1 Tax=Dreissena polymorpha TaxID=45954 RepID=A0A9D4D175_DREPO|nr:hypothetical protein DPMN_042525 [Dreissena polymorpha]